MQRLYRRTLVVSTPRRYALDFNCQRTGRAGSGAACKYRCRSVACPSSAESDEDTSEHLSSASEPVTKTAAPRPALPSCNNPKEVCIRQVKRTHVQPRSLSWFHQRVAQDPDLSSLTSCRAFSRVARRCLAYFDLEGRRLTASSSVCIVFDRWQVCLLRVANLQMRGRKLSGLRLDSFDSKRGNF